MRTLSLPDTFCGDCTPDGSVVALYPDGRTDPRLATSRNFGATFARVELPGPNVRYPVCDVIQGALCIGCSALAGDIAHLWNGTTWIPLKDKDGQPVVCYGVSSCAFGPYGLYVSTPGTVNNVKIFDPLTGVHTGSYTKPIGSSGIASVEGLGPEGVHPQTPDWYGHFGLAEYVITGGFVIGQGTKHDGLKVADRGMLIQTGLCQFNRVHRVGDQFATASWLSAEGRTVFLWPTSADFADLPPDVIAPIPPIKPPIPPVEPPAMKFPDDIFATLTANRARYPPDFVSPAQIGEILNATAWAHRGAGAGLQSKAPGGVVAIQPITGITIWNGMRIGNMGYDVCGACTVGRFTPIQANGDTADPASFVAPVNSGGTVEPPPTGTTHRYIGGGTDTGTCDQCGQPRVSDVHRVPEGKVPHVAWLGEDGIGDCDLCFAPVDAPIHLTGNVPPVEPPTGDLAARVAALEAWRAEIARVSR